MDLPDDLTVDDFYDWPLIAEAGVWYTHDGRETDMQGAINDDRLSQFLGEED